MPEREWDLEVTREFELWWDSLSESEQVSVGAAIDLLERRGPSLGFPFSSAVVISRHRGMRELRIQHAGRPFRVLYAFDSRRIGILLIGGDKTGQDRWYERVVPHADQLLDDHLDEISSEY
ncbi:MAG: type II toxin-antitoxin system RelE/ParE family toxin [Gemmatimonadales bacterium]